MENSDSFGPVSFTDSDDTSFLSAESEVLDDLINKRYRIEKRIGRGAFGVVDLVTDTKTNESKALKRVLCESANEVNDALKEVFTMRAVQHDNLLAIESVFVHTDNDTYVCFVSDFYEKGDLDKYVQWRKGNESYFDEIQICQFMLQLVAATKQLHDNNLIHRDIKPASKLFNKHNTLRYFRVE
jgi:mitogen-activated protein kinase 15